MQEFPIRPIILCAPEKDDPVSYQSVPSAASVEVGGEADGGGHGAEDNRLREERKLIPSRATSAP